MDVGRMHVRTPWSSLMLARCMESLQLAARVELVGVLGARGCVTSVRSYSDPAHTTWERAVSSSRVLLAFTLRGLPELAARGLLVYFENRV